MIIQRLLSIAALVAAVSGCASSLQGGLLFSDSMPPTVSSAWRDANGTVWIVPAKGAVIKAVESASGDSMAWRANGSYVVVPNAPVRVRVRIDDAVYPVEIPAYPTP